MSHFKRIAKVLQNQRIKGLVKRIENEKEDDIIIDDDLVKEITDEVIVEENV